MVAAGDHAQVPPWPAGALLPDTSAFAHWACRTLRAAKAEITHVVDGMIDDLEDLSAAACAGLGSRRLLHKCDGGAILDTLPEGDPSIRVHDLHPPASIHSACEQET